MEAKWDFVCVNRQFKFHPTTNNWSIVVLSTPTD